MSDANTLSGSVGGWLFAALFLFWFVGAYNRLIRLRSAALQAFATLDAALVRQLEFVQARPATASEGAAPADPAARASLAAATVQLGTLLGATRVRPLEPQGMAALGTALQALLSVWQRLYPEAVTRFDADGTLSRPALLEGAEAPRDEGDFVAPIAWPEPSAAAELARLQFNRAVSAYNAAIGQFPALLVAWLMQMRPAAPLL